MTERFRFVLPILILGVLAAAPNTSGQAPSISDATRAARTAFPAPDSSWAVVEQRFWPTHILVKLAGAADKRWYHRPTIAINARGNTYMLTHGAVRLSEDRIIGDFNSIARAERVTLTDDDMEDYASFFLINHLVNSDYQCLRPSLPRRQNFTENALWPDDVCREDSGFKLLRSASGFELKTVLVDRKAHWWARHSFLVLKDGTVSRVPRRDVGRE